MKNLIKNTITKGAVATLVLSAGAAITANAAVTRTAGADRFSTATEIFKAWPTTTDTAVLAAGVGHDVDALTVAPLAKAKNAPVLLVDTTTTTADIVAKFAAFKTVYIANGTGVISTEVETALTTAGKTVIRLGGATRTETALNIAKAIGTSNGIVIANGDNAHIVDTLSIASIAAAKGMPIFLTQNGVLDSAELAYAKGLGATNVYALGGTTVVPDAATTGIGTTVTRLAGSDRYSTNAAVVTSFKSGLDLSNIYVASGENANLIDALAGAPLAGLKNAPIVFAHNSINTDVNTLLNSVVTDMTNVVILGGTGAVTGGVETSLNAIQASKTADFKVQSATAPNAKQILVTFTKAVDATTAEDTNSYSVSGNVVDSAVKQADGKSVILSLHTAVTTSTNMVVTVQNVLLDTDSSVIVPLYTQILTINDTVAPDVASVTSTTNGDTAGKVIVTFNEPLASTAALKIDGSTVSSVMTYDATTGVSILTATGLTLDATKSHTMQVVNATDYANNVAALINKTFSITVDKVAPQVVSVTQYSDDTLMVKFDKDIAPSSATTVGNIKVAYDDLSAATITTVADSVDARTFRVKITDAGIYTSATSRNLTVLFTASVLDAQGNAITAVTKPATLVQDTTAPAVTGVVVNKNSDGKVTGLTVSLDSKIKAANPVLGDITVVNSNGVIDTTTFATLGAVPVTPVIGDKSVTLNLTTATTITGKFGFTFATGFVKDLSLAGNNSTSYSKLIDFGSATSSTNWTFLGSGSVAASGDVITVDYDNAVKGGAVAGSATDPNNYTLNGSSLPSDTVITLDSAQKVATITLPVGSVMTTDIAAIFTIKNVQETSDSLAIAPYTKTIGVDDNTAPILLSASVLDSTHIVLVYNEDMTGLAATSNADFLITVGGVTKTVAGYVDANVVGYNNKVKITLGTALTAPDLASAITIKTNANVITMDKAGNAQTTGTTVTVTK